MIQKGDWVRFQRDGKLVIGIVQYSLDEARYAEYQTVITDIGNVYESSILEVRRESIDVDKD